MASYIKRDTTTTNLIGHSFTEPETFSSTRFFTSFDLTTYVGGSQNLNGPAADGSITATYGLEDPPDESG